MTAQTQATVSGTLLWIDLLLSHFPPPFSLFLFLCLPPSLSLHSSFFFSLSLILQWNCRL